MNQKSLTLDSPLLFIYFNFYIAQIVVLGLGTRCPPRDPSLLVSCSPVPHHVFIEGPLEEHSRNLWMGENKQRKRQESLSVPVKLFCLFFYLQSHSDLRSYLFLLKPLYFRITFAAKAATTIKQTSGTKKPIAILFSPIRPFSTLLYIGLSENSEAWRKNST